MRLPQSHPPVGRGVCHGWYGRPESTYSLMGAFTEHFQRCVFGWREFRTFSPGLVLGSERRIRRASFQLPASVSPMLALAKEALVGDFDSRNQGIRWIVGSFGSRRIAYSAERPYSVGPDWPLGLCLAFVAISFMGTLRPLHHLNDRCPRLVPGADMHPSRPGRRERCLAHTSTHTWAG